MFDLSSIAEAAARSSPACMEIPFWPDNVSGLHESPTPRAGAAKREHWWSSKPGRHIAAELEQANIPIEDVEVHCCDRHLSIYPVVHCYRGMFGAMFSVDREPGPDEAATISRIIRILQIKRLRAKMLDASAWDGKSTFPPWAAGITRTARRVIDMAGLDPIEAWSRPRDHKRAHERAAAGGSYSETWYAFGEAVWPLGRLDVLKRGSVPLSADFEGCWIKISGNLTDDLFLDQFSGSRLEYDMTGFPETVLTAALGRRLGDLVDAGGHSLASLFSDLTISSAGAGLSSVWEKESLLMEIDDPIETLVPTPPKVLAAIGKADHPLAGTCFPWWLWPE